MTTYYILVSFTNHKKPRLQVDGLGSTTRGFQESRCKTARAEGYRAWVVAVQSDTHDFNFKQAVSA
jgi:hypothetical protein